MACFLVSFVNKGLWTLVVVTTLVNVVLRSLGVLACVVFPVLIVVTALSFVNVLPIALVVPACWELVILVVAAYWEFVVLIVVTTTSFVGPVSISLVVVSFLFNRF